MPGLNTLALAHDFLQKRVPKGGFCIDATAGRGYDTLFLCQLVGENGRVLAFDIQKEAVDSTLARLKEAGCSAQVVLDSHSHMERYAKAETVDAITFNFGYLPKGDHRIFTKPDTSIAAIEQGLTLLKPGGVMSLCIYSGGDTGFEERDALFRYLKTVDQERFTVLITQFANRRGDPPIPVFLLKEI